MTAEMDFSELRFSPRAAPALRPRVIAAAAATLILHFSALLWLMLPAKAIQRDARPLVSRVDAMTLVLSEPPRLTRADSPVETPLPRPIARNASRTRARVAEPAMPSSTESPADQASAPDAAHLSAQLGELAGELIGDLPAPRPSLDRALPRLPGRAQPFVHLPLRVRQGMTPQQVGRALAGMVLGTLANNPDDWEKVRTGRDPLREWTKAHLDNLIDPVCNDPEKPLDDPRCYQAE